MSKPILQGLQKHLNDLKSDIINFLLPLATQKTNPKSEPSMQTPKPAPRRSIPKPTYSDIAAKKPAQSTIIVKTPKNSDTNAISSAPEIINRISKHISQTNNSATIQKTATPSDDKVIIKFNAKDNVEAIAGELRSELGLDARGRSPLLPKMTISHIPAHVDLKTDLRESIIKENPLLQPSLEQGGTFDILFTYTAKDFGSAVIKTSANIRSAIIANNMAINIGNRACPVRDRLQPLRCTKCCAFGHTRSHCRSTSLVCNFCAAGHESSACPHKTNNDKHHCHNCSQRDHPANHTAFDKDCPTLKSEIRRLLKNTDYGKGQPPKI